jgi:DNA topoisomerase-3
MRVFLCEKPSQGRDIAKHVGASRSVPGGLAGPGVVVTWCIGHLLEQSDPDHYLRQQGLLADGAKGWDLAVLPVLPNGKWAMHVKSSTKEQFGLVKKHLASATEVVIATDADREGEVIAREVMDLCGYRGGIKRLWLGALDDASVKKALAKLLPNDKTLPMYYSGMGRGRADWLVGMNFTRALTLAFGGGGKAGLLSVGRVQTPTLALVVKRQQEIDAFVPKAYYVLSTVWEMLGTQVPMDYMVPKELLDHDGHVVKPEILKAVAAKVAGKAGRLVKVQTEPGRELAPLLYSLGSLQQEASRRFGLKAQQVLDVCQSLYEKHKATTYPRTDCEYLPQSMWDEAAQVLQAVVKADGSMGMLVQKATLERMPRTFNDKKVTAHHAVIPTVNSSFRVSQLSAIELKVYDLIRRRFIAQFLGDHEFNSTEAVLVCEGEHFRAVGKMPTKVGWKLVEQGSDDPAKPRKPSSEADDDATKSVVIPAVKVGDQALNRKADVHGKKTKPPKPYTEGTLLAAMENIHKVIEDERLKKVMQNKEKVGIGTDATRSSIIERLFSVGYMETVKKAIVPTQKGKEFIGLLKQVAPMLADPVLTALWEDRLSKVESGEVALEQFEREIGQFTTKLIEHIKARAGTVTVATQAKEAGPSAVARPRPAVHAGKVLRCPKCGQASLQLQPKIAKCVAPQCGFLLWPTVAQRHLTEQEIETLVGQGRTQVLEGFISAKTGNFFNAALVLNKDTWKIEFVFDNKPT